MKFSHSKLNCILSNPMEYFLSYVEGIQPKEEKAALALGSAVHWGIEHNTENLEEYYKKKGSFKQKDNYSKDNLLAEAMVHGYFKHKDELFNRLLTNPKTEGRLTLLDEQHEIYLNGQLKSNLSDLDFHEFVGIIDLLLVTDEGFIVVDYKTSSQVPDWDNYKEQLYRYIMLLRQNFPETPIVKIAIINLRKTCIRQKKNENEDQFFARLKYEYEINDEEYVNYHEFPMKDIDTNLLDNYIENLGKMCDMAYTIDKNKMWYINFTAANTAYGKSAYWDIFYKTPDNYVLYKISDKIWNEENNSFDEIRDCIPLDMQVIDSNCLNKYSIFKNEYQNFFSKNIVKDKKYFEKYLINNYIVDKDLLNKYYINLQHDA